MEKEGVARDATRKAVCRWWSSMRIDGSKGSVALWVAASVFAFAAFGWQLTASGQTVEHDLAEIMVRMDELYRSESSYSDVEMEIVTPNWQRTLHMNIWTEGVDKTFIRILAPKKEKGVGTLRLSNEMWNYFPKTNKIMKIPPSMMMGSWMGSDFTNDDIVKEVTYLDDYTYEWMNIDSPEAGVLYIKCTPKEGVPVVWGHLVMAIREADYLPLWEKYYDEKNRLMRTLTFSDIRDYGDRTLPATMEVIPVKKDGHKTVVRYTSAEFDIPLDDDVFSIRNLRSPK
jgi:outer membrane lipoprotein-sorting protein